MLPKRPRYCAWLYAQLVLSLHCALICVNRVIGQAFHHFKPVRCPPAHQFFGDYSERTASQTAAPNPCGGRHFGRSRRQHGAAAMGKLSSSSWPATRRQPSEPGAQTNHRPGGAPTNPIHQKEVTYDPSRAPTGEPLSWCTIPQAALIRSILMAPFGTVGDDFWGSGRQ